VIEINSDGRFANWPDGFFDAYNQALSDMLA
jgi:predicted ATPase